MDNPHSKSPEKAWQILTQVSQLLDLERDENGEYKDTAEVKELLKMKAALEREISNDASSFLRMHGFDASGEKIKPGSKKRMWGKK